MKFTFSWLQKFLKTKKNLKDICEKLTLLGIEVSEIIDNQDTLQSFKVAQVVDVKDHPNADRLKLCKINDGNKTFNHCLIFFPLCMSRIAMVVNSTVRINAIQKLKLNEESLIPKIVYRIPLII